MKIVCWGMGNTAKENLEQIKALSNRIEVVAFTDSSQTAGGNNLLWAGYRLISPQMVQLLSVDYICILSIYEWEIRKKIYKEALFDLKRVVGLHEISMIDTFGEDLDRCYEKMMQNTNLLCRVAMNRWITYDYLKRNYSYIICGHKSRKENIRRKVFLEESIRPVWILWLQGFENAPELVKICVHSIKRKLGKQEYVCLLDKDNLIEYIDLPEYIVKKWKQGIISNTHFSDIVRLRLLNTYGGVWMDATVYFTGSSLPDYIKGSNLFMFNIWESWKKRQEAIISANWLISAEPGNKLLMILETLLHEYWKSENDVRDYLLFHIFWTMVVECFPDEWDEVENILRDPAHLLANELTCQFSAKRFKRLKKISDIHKLSYKLPYTETNKDSFWAKICELERRSLEDL